ncbi:cobaltochelatase subunit CobN [Paracoccus aminophilus]|uniref:Cobaltochelatase subunit CobN n=1 Tax=Paracoccus aminophilus JCM 7686 TaxID=1367847 RepID=S5XLZ7_PARAH|nr:cobaltochelatase subunit CobN [Paracoccus aminophilus]AGT08294.1 cobaltochelatase subunit CobN [Paracoccus aminophilus JCM 7686]
MHVIFREAGGLEDSATPQDLGQTPADLVVLSFSDSDLADFAEGWRRGRADLPGLRLAPLARLTHPVSVDQYIEATLMGARFILVRLLGGQSYWPHGVMALQDLARRRGIALAFLRGDGRDDPALQGFSTVAPALWQRLNRLCAMGGHLAAGAALRLMAGLEAEDPAPLPEVGWLGAPPEGNWIAIPFYRSWMLAGDTAPIEALIAAFAERGVTARGIFLPSLKSRTAQDFLKAAFAAHPPQAIINTTAFSTQDADCALRSGPPVFQAVLSTAEARLWEESSRGLSPADMAMHVVLPEVDGRIPAQIISLKGAAAPDPDLQIAVPRHTPLPERIAALVDRVLGWTALQSGTPPLAIVLSTYPGKAWLDAHAVGLDACLSAEAILRDLGQSPAPLAPRLRQEVIDWPLAEYLDALAELPAPLRQALHDHWGAPETDPQITGQMLRFPALREGPHLIALQPERGRLDDRETGYHDLTAPPRHAYVAFYLWLSRRVGAIIHIGAHGTLEWLPGKSVAQSAACWPEALTGALPVIYPFIVNDPGEAAQARRRLGAVTLGHMPPPLKPAQLPEKFVGLEQMLDRYSTADGIDPARRDRLAGMIRDEAGALGLFSELGLAVSDEAQALGELDRFVCELKESRYTDGLHIWGEAPGEREGLARALAGLHVAPGPSGSPWRGAADVMPTGRNLYAVDPRALPAPEAVEKGRSMAAEFIRSYLQDHGDWPQSVMIDLWGSATMRTGGEDFAMALALAGLAPIRDPGTGRVTGIEVTPLAELGRPRIGVILKISGLFRDSFPVLIQLFTLGCRMLSGREEDPSDNPYLDGAPRVFGPKDGVYGTGIALDAAPAEVGAAWLANGGFTHDGQTPSAPAAQALAQAIERLSAHLHTQDLPETDLLMAEDYAAHIGGVAAALQSVENQAALYHLDNTRQDRVVLREIGTELARITHTRAGAPAWIAAMMRHGARGAGEITASLDHLAAFARLTGRVAPHLFDEIAKATLLEPEVMEFLRAENPAAHARLLEIFETLLQSGLWSTRHNEILARLAPIEAPIEALP